MLSVCRNIKPPAELPPYKTYPWKLIWSWRLDFCTLVQESGHIHIPNPRTYSALLLDSARPKPRYLGVLPSPTLFVIAMSCNFEILLSRISVCEAYTCVFGSYGSYDVVPKLSSDPNPRPIPQMIPIP